MKRKRCSPEQIIRIFNEADSGATNIDLCRKYGISEQTFYNWRTTYGGMTINKHERPRCQGLPSAHSVRP
jgi:putative transposase